MKRAIVTIVVVVAWGGVCYGRIITVDNDGAADFDNIQAAIDDSNDGDTVLVADGTYTGDGNRDIDLHGKAITVKSENGPENCIIDCNGTPSEPHRGFYFHSGEQQDSVLSGVTVTKGYAVAGAGIYCDRGSPTIENCIIARNQAEGAAGICWLFNSSQEAALSGCVIADNRADYLGGIYVGTYGPYTSSLTVRNCLIARNTAVYEGGGAGADTEDVLTFEACTFADNSAELGGGLYCLQGRFVLRNCIFWGNSAAIGPEISDGGCHCAPPCTVVDIYYCDLEGGREGVHADYCGDYGIFFREGCIDADPWFADPNKGDYHLRSQAGRYDPNEGRWKIDEVTSPCIDVGDPMSPIGLEPFPNGGQINMGAYGGTAEASKSYFGDPVCQTIVAGDVNGDCNVDFEDFRLMALHWLEDNRPCGTVTSTYLFQADPNALTTSGGQGGGQGSFSIEGRFELTVDSNGGPAWFEQVDATLSREAYFYDHSAGDSIFTDSLDVLFQMTELVSTDVNKTRIDFVLERVNCPPPACLPPYTDIHLRATFVESSVHLVGDFCDPCCDLFCFHLDAVAVREP